MAEEPNIKNGEHRLIWLKIEGIEKFLTNHVSSRLDKLDAWMWKIVFLILGSVLIPLTALVILRVFKVI